MVSEAPWCSEVLFVEPTWWHPVLLPSAAPVAPPRSLAEMFYMWNSQMAPNVGIAIINYQFLMVLPIYGDQGDGL